MPDYEKPDRLYDIADLLRGYDQDDPLAFTKPWDFATYRRFISDGAAPPRALEIRLVQAEHDARVAGVLKRFLDRAPKPKLVGVMGGNGLLRPQPAYIAVAQLGRHLTQNGYLLVTGGGPGAMEAAHLGATFSAADHAAFNEAFALATVPSLPPLDDILTLSGDLAPGYESKGDVARQWLNKTLEVRNAAPKERGESLAIPTWFHGSEPSTAFARALHQVLLEQHRRGGPHTQSHAGIIYAQGGGGTLRKIFEDAEQNYYAATHSDFTPMILQMHAPVAQRSLALSLTTMS
ncbi:hypothetical protein ACFFWD_01060 [Bradyrhizobium erythrophlei]|uniref:SLOG cluster 4 domain-containing protein n=1 Tax=Bradyrhizobium erythrophlei TaxID=1437360 RepID=UPI0035EA9093